MKLINLFLLFNILNVPNCISLRRISSGTEVTDDVSKRYVVYLIKSSNSEIIYDEWLCGGALVSTWFILTSAACVEDVDYIYAIAGYKKYVRDKFIEDDECTRNKKKKVVYICYPVKYVFSYIDLPNWSYLDIALAKVESEYDLTDESYKKLCSYIPAVIPISYEERHSRADVDALVFGWGHADRFRSRNDPKNYNLKTLMYASVSIINKTLCKKEYRMYDVMELVIDRFMICSMGRGMLDLDGNITYGDHHPPPVKQTNCSSLPRKNRMEDILSVEEQTFVEDKTRRDGCGARSNTPQKAIRNRTYGICQNDHGGPLVTWVGANEVLIGVASVYKVSKSGDCEGPYLYTSTHCTGTFIDCVLSGKYTNTSDSQGRARGGVCNGPPIQRGYDIGERYISWSNHRDSAAETASSSDEDNVKTTKKPKMYSEQFGKVDKFWESFKT